MGVRQVMCGSTDLWLPETVPDRSRAHVRQNEGEKRGIAALYEATCSLVQLQAFPVSIKHTLEHTFPPPDA
eukprot:5645200-Amphidinium_carterae.1